MKYAVAIIGAGAAGMMAAVKIKEALAGIEISLFEKNDHLGAKVIISGGGRCNVTTGIMDVRELLKNYPRGAKFLMTAMYHFSPEKVMEWFEAHNVPLKTEEDLRIFPQSDNGKDVVGALEKELTKTKTKIYLKSTIVEIKKENGKFIMITGDKKTLKSDYLIITTGGNAYRRTGSTGDGYAFAKSLGHTMTPLAASLHSFITAEEFVRDVSGVSFEKTEIKLTSFDGQRIYKRTGPFLFTHKGISGPAIFALSSQSAYEAFSKEKPMKLTIDFFSEKKEEESKKMINELIQKNPKKYLAGFLDILLPKSLSGVMAKIVNIQKNMADTNKIERQKILDILKKFELTLVGRGAGEEFVTAGGVNLEEVNTNTMESKITPNLYFAGEVLDMDGYTGGFNLQAAWASGACAGESIVKNIKAK